MNQWLILMPLYFAVQFAAMLVMETLGIEKKIDHAIGAGIACSL
jgi:hypothetical protein